MPSDERHRIEALIGRGGVGSVYRAYDSARERTVALKRLEVAGSAAATTHTTGSSASQASSVTAEQARKQARRQAQLVALFQREYGTLAQLAHPRIIEVYDYAIDEQGPYYTMELLAGRDLSSAAPMPWRRACEVLRDVASALTLLHSRRLLHRDISPRNVHCAESGAAKLIDFGAMTPMGPCDVLVGTPAFVAPEVIQKQALDARADLYSLGALAYFLLTGRTAHNARSFSELHDAYRSFPVPPAQIAKDVPPALDALVMQLLSVDRSARPSSAVELVERLTAIAGLEHDARLAVATAYLATPALVGRQKELVVARRIMLRVIRGRGSSLLVSGAPGVGRSRFLDACALEGKLAGALVLRGAPGAAGGVDYGVLRSLLLQLHDSFSEAERRAYEPPAALRSQLLPGFLWIRANSRPVSLRPAPPTGDPSAVPAALTEYLTHVSKRRPLAIVIDDVQAIDEPSAAAIAALAASGSRRQIAIVAACATQTAVHAEAALRLLRAYCRPLALEPLAPQDTESLLASVFGSVPNIAPLAHRLHALSGGRPRACMELAQHLVDVGVVRYEAGGFVVPETLSASDLPESLEAALRTRFERLSTHARELGYVIALSAGAPLTIAQCFALSAPEGSLGDGRGPDMALAERALGDLLASHLVSVEDEHVSLRQGVLATALLSSLAPERVRGLHARIAALLERDAELRVLAAEHYLEAGPEHAAAGLDLLLPYAESGRLIYETSPSFHRLVDAAIAACTLLHRPARQRFMLLRAKLHHVIHYTERCDPNELLAFGDELARLSGLRDWQALETAGLDPDARLMRAAQAATDRYERTPPAERTYSPEQAIPELARFMAALAGQGSSSFDLELLERIPSLGDYVRLAPGILVAEWIVNALRDLRASRHDAYIAGVRRVLARLDESDHAGLPAREHKVTRLGVLYVVALTEAALGDPAAFSHAEELDALPSMRISAWRVRQIAHLHRGDAQQADVCRKRLELLVIEHGAAQAHQGTTLETEFMCYAFSDDLVNLRRVLPELEAMAAKHPGWRPPALLARAELERIRGRLDAAFALYEQVLEMARPGRHMMWPYAAGFYVRALVQLGRAHEARALGLLALVECDRHQMGVLSDNLLAAVASAEAELGAHDAAAERIDAIIARLESEHVSGMFVGLHYEDRARLALRMGDGRTFGRCVEQWRAHYGTTPDSPFTGRAARLLAEARRAGFAGDGNALVPEKLLIEGATQRLRRELGLCVDVEQCAERALALMIEITSAHRGHFYVLQNGELVLQSSSHGAPPEALQVALATLLQRLDSEHDSATEVVDPDAEIAPDAGALPDHDGLCYSVSEIVGRDARIVAAVVLAFPQESRRRPPAELLAALADELMGRGDFTRITLLR